MQKAPDDLNFEARLRVELARRTGATDAPYRLLTENSIDVIALLSHDGTRVYVSPSCLQLTGYTPKEMRALRTADTTHPDDVARVLEVLGNRHGQQTVTYRMRRKDGDYVWVETTCKPLDGPGREDLRLAIVRNVDERVRVNQRLKESEERYRFLADNSADLIILVAQDGKRVYVSPACERMLGFTREEMLELNTRDAVHPEDADRLLEILGSDELMLANPTIRYRTRRKDGSYIWVETVGTPVSVHGQESQRLVVIRDIEQRVLTEQRLSESEARYRMLADNSSDMVFQLDHDLIRRYVSPACRELLGYEPEEMIGVKPASMVHPDDAPRIALVFQSLMNGSANQHSIVNRIRHRDGRWIWVEARFRALKDPTTGVVTGIVGALRDISDLQKSKELLHSTLTALSEGVVVQDMTGRIISCNPAAESILEIKPDDLWGVTAADTNWRAIREDGRDFPSYEHPSALALLTGEPQKQVVMGLRRNDGSLTWISINSVPVLVEGNAEQNTVVTSLSDITARKNAQEVLTEAVNASPDALVIYDETDRLVTCNEAYRQIYAKSAASIFPGAFFEDVVRCGLENNQYPEAGETPAERSAWLAERMRLHRAGSTDAFQRLSNGRWIQLRERRTASGLTIGFRIDVTELRNKTAELETTNARFDAALSNMTQGLCMFDANRKLIISNGAFQEMYNARDDQVRPGSSAQEMLKLWATGADELNTSVGEQVSFHAAQRSQIYRLSDGRVVSIKRTPLADGGWVATHEDITERERISDRMNYLALHDTLTGLANRAEFNTKLLEVSRRRSRADGTFTVMLLDLDKFKAVNDTLGHPAGDQLLIEVGRRLKSTLRETDTVARLGGDEFAIIQEDSPDQNEGAITLALRIIQVISQPFDLDGHAANVGTSIGIALAPAHGVKPEDLLKSADLALYDVKAGGRNDFRVFQPEMLEIANTQQSAESELRNAIEREEFELHYQPVTDVKTRQLSGVEALVRWRHSARGLVGPDQFIPLAEATGLIVPLGDWVLQRACADAASWPAHIKVAINVSAVQFKKGNLFDVILCTLVETGLSPERLELEFTETALLGNQEAHLRTIRQLKNLGISVALDDFGTGCSSMSCLTLFPFDKVKIDKSFAQGVLNRRDCKAVVASTLALAQGLHLLTTADGIETEEQLAYMRAAGVDLVQGHLIGRPVPVSKLDLNSAGSPKEMVA